MEIGKIELGILIDFLKYIFLWIIRNVLYAVVFCYNRKKYYFI